MSGWFDEGTEEHPEHDTREASRGSGRERSHEEPRAGAGVHDEGRDSRDDDDADESRERYRVKGDELLKKVKQIVREGNVRKITIRNESDEVLLSFPLAAGVLGAALLPMWAAVGAVAALVGNCSIDVERRE